MATESKPRTLYEKIWDAHVVSQREDGTALLYIDRHLVHEVTSPQAFDGLRAAGRKVRRPDLTLAVPDHNLPTTARVDGAGPSSADRRSAVGANNSSALTRNTARIRRRLYRCACRRAGHRPRRRPGAGLHAARHHRRLRRQPYREPRRARRARLRHRHIGGGACARHADAAAQAVEVAGGARRWRARAGA